MSRHRTQQSYSHHIKKMGSDDFRISWMVDRYVNGSRLRFPTSYSRDTDWKGAKRFAKRWGLTTDAMGPGSPTPEET